MFMVFSKKKKMIWYQIHVQSIEIEHSEDVSLVIFNYIIGPAGSGKTTLVATTYNHLSANYNSLRVITVNLDPGVRNLPYTPDVDIRDYIVLEEVMDKYGLGPNGGLVAATDLIIASI